LVPRRPPRRKVPLARPRSRQPQAPRQLGPLAPPQPGPGQTRSRPQLTPTPLVSVIIPVYNGALYIGIAIDSALTQTYPHLEVIVVDDGSTDATLSILHLYAAQDPRVRVLTQPNAGVAAARNTAIAAARGDLIAPLDADDLWLPHKLERQVAALLAAPPDTALVYCWWVWIDTLGTVLDRSPSWRFQGHILERLLQINFTGNASVPLFRRRALQDIGGYNSSLAAARSGGCEDWEVALLIAARHPVAVVPEILLGYRRLHGSMSQACDMMWRSKELVHQHLREARPDLPPAVFRASNRQYNMYLAGLAFWSGNLRGALTWALQAGLRLPIQLAPHVLKMFLTRRSTPTHPITMRPGHPIDTTRLQPPLLPYDKIYPSP
jgi:glycosyltransferase involved in cell wall biosynthesis